MIKAIGIAITGLDAAAKKIAASASNVANLQTTGSLSDKKAAPYTPLTTTQTTGNTGEVTAGFTPKTNPFVPAYDPSSPYADENGYIGVPNINLAEEAVNLTLAKHSYKANLEVIKTSESMMDELLDAFDKEV